MAKKKKKPDEWPKRTELTAGNYHLVIIWWNLHIEIQIKPLTARGNEAIIVQKGWFNVGAGTPDVTVMMFNHYPCARTGQAEITALLDWLTTAQSIGLSLDTVILTKEDFEKGVTVAMVEGRLECVAEEATGEQRND